MPRIRWRLAHVLLSVFIAFFLCVTTTSPVRANFVSTNQFASPEESGGVSWSDPSAAGIPGTSQYSNAPGLDPPAPLFVVRAKRGGPIVRAAPSESAKPLGGLYYDTYLTVVGEAIDAAGVAWYEVRLWGSLPGWLRADQAEPGDPPPLSPLVGPTSESAAWPGQANQSGNAISLSAEAFVREQFNIRDAPTPGAGAVGVADPGDRVTVQAYQSDASGSVWYRVVDGSLAGWVWGGGLDLASSSSLPRPRDANSLAAVKGKGMWLPIPLVAMASPEAIADAAKGLGLTHIYLEAGDSGRGFYGKEQAERLLGVAHRSGLTVIAWALTSLKDVSVDLALCDQIARFRSASGDGFDGLAPDIEDNLAPDDVRTFSEILRARLGPRALLVGVIYPVGSEVGVRHPVAGILSRSVDALAPMAYWHVERRPYTPVEIADFITASVANVHAAVGDESFPVEIIGQAYDGFGRNGAGVYNPTGVEVGAALSAARAGGAFGVSLFQWGTTTPSEWEALRQMAWP